MKRFIRNVGLFFIAFSVLIGVLFLLINGLIKNDNTKFILESKIDKIFTGDSHIRHSINDSLIRDSKNVALSSEGFIYSYSKIDYLVRNNPQIHTVYLGVSYHSFSDYYDHYIYKEPIALLFYYYLPIFEQFKILMKVENPVSFLVRSSVKGIDSIFRYSDKNHCLGSFQNYKTDVKVSLESINKRIKEQYYLNKKARPFSEEQLYYFNKIITYCNENNICLVIVNTPLYELYKESVPEKFRNKYYLMIDDNNLNIIDFNNLKLEKIDFLPDGDHVSAKGANLTTLYLNEIINKSSQKLLEE